MAMLMDRFLLTWFICIISTVLTFEIICIIIPFLNSYYYLVARYAFCLIVGHWIFWFTKGSLFKKRINPNKKAVFITGCDSGFGFNLAKRLDSQGYHVFAGCLFPTSGGAAELKKLCSSRFCTVHIDVTQDDSVEKAKEFVVKNLGDCELWAVVNNAGVFKGLSVELSPVSTFVDVLQVNTLGLVRTTKAFLPLIRRSKGRVVNVNSLAGRNAFPLLSCYTMSKFATVAFTECLRRELDIDGVKVVSIEPELFKTPMSDAENLNKQMETIKASSEENFKSNYSKNHIKRMKLWYMYCQKFNSPNIHNVIDAMEAAVSMQHPCSVYEPSGNAIRRIIFHFLQSLPDHLIDVNIRILNAADPVLGPLLSALM